MVIIREITTVHIPHNAVVQPSCHCRVHMMTHVHVVSGKFADET